MSFKIKMIFAVVVTLMFAIFMLNFAFRKPITLANEAPSLFAKIQDKSTLLSDIRLSIILTATVMAPEAIMFEGGRWLKSRKMAHGAVLVCHPDGLLMFDTGLGRDIDKQFKAMPFFLKPLFKYEVIAPAIEQLDRETFCPGKKLQIILSHLHWDHASGIEDFPMAPVWTRPEELASGRKEGNHSGYLEGQFDDKNIDWRSLDFSNNHYLNYQTSLDFFGDGSVVLVPMSGHTKGATGMFVNMGGDKNFFFTGDTSWGLEGFTRPAHKHALMRAILDGNLSGLEQEIRRVNTMMKRNPGLHVIPAHDYNAYAPAAIYPDDIAND